MPEKCPECRGLGVIRWQVGDFLYWHVYEKVCPKCNGTKILEEKKLTFLETIGKKIEKAEEVKKGDIVAKCTPASHGDYDDVHLYCVKRVQLKPEPKTFIWPAVYMKAPSIGMRVKDKPFYWHVYSPCLGHTFEHDWYEKDAEGLKDLESFGTKEYEPYDLYLVTDEEYIALGNLINQVEIPWWSFLCQNRFSKDNIVKFVADIQDDLRKGKEAFDSINNKVRRWDVQK